MAFLIVDLVILRNLMILHILFLNLVDCLYVVIYSLLIVPHIVIRNKVDKSMAQLHLC